MQTTGDLSLEQAYRAHASAVEALARRLCGADHAADVTQEVFLRLAQRPFGFDPARGSLRTYLLTIGHHVAVDRLRCEQAHRAREDRYLVGCVDAEPDVAVDVADRDDRALVLELLARLPSDERVAVVAAFSTERTYREVAVELGAAEGTIKSRIRRGLRRMHAMAAEEALATSAS